MTTALYTSFRRTSVFSPTDLHRPSPDSLLLFSTRWYASEVSEVNMGRCNAHRVVQKLSCTKPKAFKHLDS